MGTNFYWIKQVENEEVLDWQINLRSELNSLDDLPKEELHQVIESYIKNNIYSIYKQEETREDEEREERYRLHIGKRSAAGLYCWDCNQTFCKKGESHIHNGRFKDRDRDWHKKCPSCNKVQKKDEEHGSGMIELGFSNPKPSRPTGVQTCSSFSWAQEPETVFTVCKENENLEIIVDEYGRKMSGREFLDMLDHNCPVRFTEWIGANFS